MSADEKTKVLMVDDEKFLLDIYKTYFEKDDCEVQVFHDVDSALKALRGGYEPDVVLFDITMPDSRSGYEFIEAVHSEKLAKKSLKIALTNEGQSGALQRMSELGADGHLLKAQYLPREIAQKVSEMLAEKKKHWF